MYELEYYMYHGGYGPTNETLGKFIRELFCQPSTSINGHRSDGTVILDHTARLQVQV
jgi:hypothetical protein